MKKITSFSFLFFLIFSAECQLDSLSKLEYEVSLNDVWGYVDKFGYEYALVGLYNGLSIVEISNPSSPVEIYRSTGPETSWRDIKVFGNYVYVTNEAENGMRIYDLSGLPGNHQIPYKYFNGEQGKKFETAHNLFIDEKGRAFVVGTDREDGMIIYDLAEDPWNPKEIGFYNEEYIHDIYVRNDTAFSALINKGCFYILDVSNPENINLVSSHYTKDLQTHNTWLSIDGNYLFTTDEVNGAEIGVYDISDRINPEKVEFFKSRLLGDETPHNVLVKDSVAFISYYKDGVIAIDISNPENVLEVGRFDTNKRALGPGFSGAWGVYPFLPSGNILVSDIENGLYVLGFNKRDAAYLEGVVKDKETGYPLNGVKVKVLDEGKEDKTYYNGAYKVGKIGDGLISVEFKLFGYKTKVINTQIDENKIFIEDVLLEKLEMRNLLINLSLQDNNSPNGISVHIEGEDSDYEIISDSTGIVEELLPDGNYIIYVGKWGYVNYCFTHSGDSIGDTLSIELVKGFYDDFSVNQGWEVFSVNESPVWERAKPKASFNLNTGFQHDPSEDATINDCSDWAFCTGINEDFSASSTTVNWTNYLVSPEFQIPSPNIDATISFSYWLGLSQYSNDTIKVGLVQGKDTVYVKNFISNDELLKWKETSFNVENVFNSSGPFKFIVRVTDDLTPWDMVDCAIDEFSIVFTNGVDEVSRNCFNPLNSGWDINCLNKDYIVLNLMGQIVKKGHGEFVDMRGLNSGVYIIKIVGNITQKIYWSEEN